MKLDFEAFLKELTELSHKHGIIIQSHQGARAFYDLEGKPIKGKFVDKELSYDYEEQEYYSIYR